MSAERLREAAKVLRGHIEGLTTDRARWDEAFPVSRVYADKGTYERLIVHPGVGLALANALDSAAEYDPTCDDGGNGEAMNADLRHLAALILVGGTQ